MWTGEQKSSTAAREIRTCSSLATFIFDQLPPHSLLAAISQIEEFLHKMAIALKNWRVEQKNHSFLINWPVCALSSQHLFRLNAVLSVHLCISISLPRLLSFLGPTAPFGRPSASLQFLHSLILPHYAYLISLCSVHDTTAEGVLSLCWCSLTLTLTPSMGIWHSAGVSKGVTTPAAHRGIWRGAGATKGVTSPAAHGGIWHRAGATKSWSSVVLLTCS